jgi:DNA-binding HxlR family transcriptional regulator
MVVVVVVVYAMADKEPGQLLKEVHGMVKDLHESSNPLSDLEPRVDVEPETHYYKVLRTLDGDEHLPSSEIEKRAGVGSATTRVLTTLYQSYMVDRVGEDQEYTYSLTALGQRALNGVESYEQTTVKSHTKPWENTNLNKVQYHALKCVGGSEDHLTSSELNEMFLNFGYTDHSEGPAISPRLTYLFKHGYVDRTPTRPYRYWLAEKGEELLND